MADEVASNNTEIVSVCVNLNTWEEFLEFVHVNRGAALASTIRNVEIVLVCTNGSEN